MKIYLSVIFIFICCLGVFGQNVSADWQKVPDAFRGNDFQKIYDLLLSTRRAKEKGEFETIADFQKRLSNSSTLVIDENKTLGDDLAFVYKPENASPLEEIKSKYDADAQVLNIEMGSLSVTASQSGPTPYNLLPADVMKYEKLFSYYSSNAYGATTTVQVTRFTFYRLAVKNWDKFSDFKSPYVPALNVNLSLPPEKAKQVKENLSVLYIGKLVEPYIENDGLSSTKATISDPKEVRSRTLILMMDVKEILLFNRLTGEILSRLKPQNVQGNSK